MAQVASPPAEPLSNTPLLRFLLAVCAAESEPGTALRHFTGYDVLETNVAKATARQFGFLGPASAEPLSLTPQGRAWVLAQLAPLSAVLSAIAPIGAPHLCADREG